jgi:hypothetical protein
MTLCLDMCVSRYLPWHGVCISIWQTLAVLDHTFTNFHVLYGDEIISVILPIFDAIYASGTVPLTRAVYRRCVLLSSAVALQVMMINNPVGVQGVGLPSLRCLCHQEHQILRHC